MPPHTHYDNLKVARNAPPEVIRAAYRVLAQRYHPDVNPSPDSARVMKVINEAYAVLSDPGRRAAHDSWIEDQLIREALAEVEQRMRSDPPGTEQRTAPPEGSPPVQPNARRGRPSKKLSNYVGTIAVLCLLVFIGYEIKTGPGDPQQRPVVSYRPPATIQKESERTWPEIARGATFESLSVAEKDSVRDAYFERVIAPKVSPGELGAARAQFYRESGHSGGTSTHNNGGAASAVIAPLGATNVARATAPCLPHGWSRPLRAAYLSGFERRASSGMTTMTIDNTSGGADVYVKLCSSSAHKCDGLRHVFIPKGERFTMRNITPGRYDVRYCSLDNGALAKSEPLQLRQIHGPDGTSYSTVTLTLYRVVGGNMHFEGISEDKF